MAALTKADEVSKSLFIIVFEVCVVHMNHSAEKQDPSLFCMVKLKSSALTLHQCMYLP